MDNGTGVNERVRLVRRYVNLCLHDLTELYKNGIRYEMNPGGKCNASIDNSIPVWVIWWQGLESVPSMVRKCISSIERSADKGNWKLHVITSDNMNEYVRLPEWIMDKFRRGIISMAHLSDMVRMELLSDYGGLYIDATYLVTGALDDIVDVSRHFMTLCNRGDTIMPFVGGRWAQNFLYVNPAYRSDDVDIFIEYLKNALYYYWASSDKIIDYYLCDFIIDNAYATFPSVRELLDNVPDSNPMCLYMQMHLNDEYTDELWKTLTRNTSVFKLTYKGDFSTYTVDGKETLYGHIVNE